MKIEIIRKCKHCKEVKEFEVTLDQYMRIEAGQEHIQDIIPEHSPDEREILISGICSSCYDRMFGGA